jgi:hypothetical protein
LVDDKELIVDKVVLINKDPYLDQPDSVFISVIMEFAMKVMFLSYPDASKTRRTFMNPSDVSCILRIGVFLVF